MNKTLRKDEIRNDFHYARILLKATLITCMNVLHLNGMKLK